MPRDGSPSARVAAGLYPLQNLWRVGRRVSRTVYAQIGADPSDDDVLIGLMDTPAIAQAAVEGHNRLMGAKAGMVVDSPLPPRDVAELLARLEAAIRGEERAVSSHDRQEAESATWAVRMALRAALHEPPSSPESTA